jgi:hypothetical protein
VNVPLAIARATSAEAKAAANGSGRITGARAERKPPERAAWRAMTNMEPATRPVEEAAATPRRPKGPTHQAAVATATSTWTAMPLAAVRAPAASAAWVTRKAGSARTAREPAGAEEGDGAGHIAHQAGIRGASQPGRAEGLRHGDQQAEGRESEGRKSPRDRAV